MGFIDIAMIQRTRTWGGTSRGNRPVSLRTARACEAWQEVHGSHT